MLEQFPHPLLPKATKDEAARQDYVMQLGAFVQNDVNPGMASLYENRVRPDFVDSHGREPADRHEVRRAMESEDYCQLAGSMQRTAQEMLWNAVDESLQRQLPDLVDISNEIAANPKYGTLTLDQAFEIPRYIANNDNHAMPGGYSADLFDGDISAGALYDRGAFLYTQGLFGPRLDGIGRAAINFIRARYPDLEPKKILDMGCTSGGPVVAIHEAWPDAETHGIDVGAALLRYAHGRAESMKAAVHFSQQSAEKTRFEPSSFDLVTCLATLHETSGPSVRRIFEEAFRLLRPGGLFVISELPPYTDEKPFELYARDWDTWHNNEPFWGPVHEIDMPALLCEVGFDAGNVIDTFAPGIAAANQLETEVVVENEKFVGSTRGGGEAWYVAARKHDA